MQKIEVAGKMQEAVVGPPTQLSFMLIEPLMVTGHQRHL